MKSRAEVEIVDLFARWVAAVQAEDLSGIRANHVADKRVVGADPGEYLKRGFGDHGNAEMAQGS